MYRASHRADSPSRGRSGCAGLPHPAARPLSRYGTIWLLLDRASAHTDHKTQALAGALDIELLWLPKQAPELNAMDQLRRELKRLIAANRQAESIATLARDEGVAPQPFATASAP